MIYTQKSKICKAAKTTVPAITITDTATHNQANHTFGLRKKFNSLSNQTLLFLPTFNCQNAFFRYIISHAKTIVKIIFSKKTITSTNVFCLFIKIFQKNKNYLLQSQIFRVIITKFLGVKNEKCYL